MSRRLISGGIGVLLLLGILAGVTARSGHMALPATAWASGQPNTITFAPASGAAGTKVQLAIWITVSATTSYTLTATTTDPANGGCASSQSIPGVAPVAVPPPDPDGIGPYQMTITWPAALNLGPYWLCAAPTTGEGPHAQSTQPFTVLPQEAPTATTVPTATAGSSPTAAAESSPTATAQPTVTPPSGAAVGGTNPPVILIGALAAAPLVGIGVCLTTLVLLRRRRRGLAPYSRDTPLWRE